MATEKGRRSSEMTNDARKKNASCCEAMDLKPVEAILEKYTGGKGTLIPVLQDVQRIYGYLPKSALDLVSEELDVPQSTIYGVATFYSQFHLKPCGKHAIRICRGTACHVNGSLKILEAVTEKLGVEVGGNTEDMKFVVEEVACTSACALAPILIIDDHTYGDMNIKKAIETIENYQMGEDD